MKLVLAPASLALFAALASPAWADPALDIHYAPEERLDRIDAELINNAATSIDIAAYVLTDWAMIDALNDAEARGVKVRVILDPRQHSAAERMVGLDVRQKRSGPIQHLKASRSTDRSCARDRTFQPVRAKSGQFPHHHPRPNGSCEIRGALHNHVGSRGPD